MHYVSINQAFLYGLLVAAPLATALNQEAASEELSTRHVGGLAAFAAKAARDLSQNLEARHHTEAQIAAKKAKAEKGKGKRKAAARDVPAPDEFGPWDSDADEFGSWVDKREPHHTEAQIAAKKAKAEKEKGKAATRDVPAPDEFGPWDSDADEFGSWVDKREPHHTEAQIAAKKAKAEKEKGKAAARDVPAPDEFGPWDSDADEFGSWVDKREPHHTEAQIAAKKAKAEKEKGQAAARDVPAPDEFGPWDSDADEFGSWVDKREPHHTEAQIAAKKAKAEKAKANARDEVEAREPHHTEAQIAAKKAKAEKDKANARDEVEAREPHHTEAQIAAKKAKAEKDKANARDEVEAREPHHTEAQIAAKKAKAEKDKGK